MFHATVSTHPRGFNTNVNSSETTNSNTGIASLRPTNGTSGSTSTSEPLLRSLFDLANDLFCKGKPEESLSLFASAISICKNSKKGNADATKDPSRNTNTTSSEEVDIFHQLQWGVEKLESVNNASHFILTQPELPDTYHEDECDVGPRPFRLPIFPDAALFDYEDSRYPLVIVYAEVLMIYNTALLHHSRSEYGEAMQLYEACALTLSKLLPEGFGCSAAAAAPIIAPTTTLLTPDLYKQLLELCMRVQNNMGQITYMLGLEDTAMNHFEASLLCAKRRMELALLPSTPSVLTTPRSSLTGAAFTG